MINKKKFVKEGKKNLLNSIYRIGLRQNKENDNLTLDDILEKIVSYIEFGDKTMNIKNATFIFKLFCYLFKNPINDNLMNLQVFIYDFFLLINFL